MSEAPPTVAGTELYHSAISYDYGDPKRNELMEKVWRGTPWIVDCFTGGWHADRDREAGIREWCTSRWGREAWPIHGHPGSWHRGSATVYGWTWMGFETEAMMLEFMAAWPTPDYVPPKGTLNNDSEQDGA